MTRLSERQARQMGIIPAPGKKKNHILIKVQFESYCHKLFQNHNDHPHGRSFLSFLFY